MKTFQLLLLVPVIFSASVNMVMACQKLDFEEVFVLSVTNSTESFESTLESFLNNSESKDQSFLLEQTRVNAGNRGQIYERLSSKMIDRNDNNKDGKLSRDELSTEKPYLVKKFKDYDLNKNAFLEKEEIINYYQSFIESKKNTELMTGK